MIALSYFNDVISAFHFWDDVTPRLHQSQPFPKSRGWLLSQSEPSHQNEARGSEGASFTTRGVVKCLYDRTNHLIARPSVFSEKKKHLSSLLFS